jgi:hypothetical protein
MADETQARLSRRGLIKGVGAGTALAWSAPTILGVGSQAFAGSPTCPSPCTDCFSISCGVQSSVCGNNCLCSIDTEDNCFCAQNVFGSGECTTSADCEANERCMNICARNCAGTFCLPACNLANVNSTLAGEPARSA